MNKLVRITIVLIVIYLLIGAYLAIKADKKNYPEIYNLCKSGAGVRCYGIICSPLPENMCNKSYFEMLITDVKNGNFLAQVLLWPTGVVMVPLARLLRS